LRLEEGENMPFDLEQRWDAYTGVWESVRFGLWPECSCLSRQFSTVLLIGIRPDLLQTLLSGRWSGICDLAFANFYTDVGM